MHFKPLPDIRPRNFRPQNMIGDVGVNFGCCDTGMAEQLLNEANVDAGLQQLGRRRMPEHVWSDAAGQVGGFGKKTDDAANVLFVGGAAQAVEE